ncbi:Ig-like domain-containing protein [Leifsonia poae]|uniref:Ig-like domain-containing protein n=1 Tax=Leifsonia poae TaxID=110933 RepID=UPI003D693762
MVRFGVRGGIGAVAALAVAFLITLGTPSAPASASFASQCATPTRTLDPSASSVSLAPGETVLLASGTFTGGVNALPSGATLCVAAGATLQPAYLNNGAGTVIVAAGATATFPSLSVGTGFALQAEGSVTFAGLNVNGASRFAIASGGTMAVSGSFSPSAGVFDNRGTLTVGGSLNLNGGASIENAGRLTVGGDALLNGRLDNTGRVDVAGILGVNGGATFANACQVRATGAITNDAAASANAGIVVAGGTFRNNGTWRQSVEGLLAATGLTDDGTVSGFGAYQFTGPTSVQGRFTGDSAGNPIQVQTQAPAGSIFDVQTGTIANVIRVVASRSTSPDAPLSGCSNNVLPFADLSVTKSGPGTVLPNGDIAYTITVTNDGPDEATGVVVHEVLPPEATGVVDADGGTVANGSITWTVGSLAVGASASFGITISESAPVGTVLRDAASATSDTADPNPSDNDGTSEDSQVDTVVVAAPPPANSPPVADPLVQPGFTDELLFGRVTATDPDAGQELIFSITTPPAHGIAVMVAGGGFAYRSDPDFTGDDAFTFTVCDDGTPVLCDSAVVSLPISPTASDDTAVTGVDTPVTIPVTANDSLGAALQTTLPVSAANGITAVDAGSGSITYTPSAGFTGLDTFRYRTCSPTNPALCATATVTVVVRALNRPPVVDALHLVTSVGAAVTDTIHASDPDIGQTLTFARGIPPRSGTASVADDRTTYTPRANFAGADAYAVIACDDGDPVLCSTGDVTVDVYPVANPDSASTAQDTPVSIPVSGNDLGAVTAPVVASTPAHGTVRVDGATIVYVPDPGFAGTDTFDYTICAVAAPTLCATTTVTVDVAAAVAPPIVPDDGGGSSTADVAGDLSDTGSSSPVSAAAGAALGAMVLGAALLGSAALRRRPRRR